MNLETIDDFFNALRGAKGNPTLSVLTRISPLPADDRTEFTSKFKVLPVEEKKGLLQQLVELTEENVALEFSDVFQICFGDPDEEVRELAIRGLWESEERSLIRLLVKSMTSDSSSNVRAAAALGLRRFAILAQDGKLIERDRQRVRGALLAAIGRSGEVGAVKRRAIEAVACFEDPEVTEIIQNAYQSTDSKLKESAIFAMGQTSNPKWMRVIMEETHSDDASIRYEAVTAIGRLGDESTVSELINLIQDEDFQVQVATITALGTIGGSAAKLVLQQCLESDVEPLEQTARLALANLELENDPLGLRANDLTS